ncbi:MAG: hypothetical protein ACPGUV_02445 [Polyangiales bacterium]
MEQLQQAGRSGDDANATDTKHPSILRAWRRFERVDERLPPKGLGSRRPGERLHGALGLLALLYAGASWGCSAEMVPTTSRAKSHPCGHTQEENPPEERTWYCFTYTTAIATCETLNNAHPYVYGSGMLYTANTVDFEEVSGLIQFLHAPPSQSKNPKQPMSLIAWATVAVHDSTSQAYIEPIAQMLSRLESQFGCVDFFYPQPMSTNELQQRKMCTNWPGSPSTDPLKVLAARAKLVIERLQQDASISR